ncbi:hypothetical protein [Pseudemcibacter aquimaris]|uniref:hypothetical protein n=1 Tax=Pseudemcibacter aquimaris TaxID=2857064 RepID=UPI00201248A0|nr:hypothetical protein [Pseudemcibacter aquimaris]MCC3860618.1 hypothetical protein [Pseudemcibacter aquimaris]WDU59437.1 hypothetical protein KW060_04080 [Pseudemcibacter aquimaris]
MFKKLIAIIFAFSFTSAQAQNLEEFTVENIHFHMGVIAAFAEVVNLEVKQVGLSELFTEEEATKWEPVVKHIAERNGVEYYRENDFLVTDLFPASKTNGLTLFVIYKDDTLDKYLALKKRKAELIASNKYDAAGRREIAVGFGEILDYSDEVIERLIKSNGAGN